MNNFSDRNFKYVDFKDEFPTSEDLVSFIVDNTSLNVKEGIAGYVVSNEIYEARIVKGMVIIFSSDDSSEKIGNLILSKLK